MSEQFVKMPVDILLFSGLSPLEMSVFMHLRYEIMTQGNNLKKSLPEEEKYCCKTSKVMADRIGIGRAAYIKALHSLEKIKLIKVESQKNGSQSNHIYLTVGKCIEFLQNGGSVKSPEVYLKDTPQVYLKDSEVYLKDSEVYLKDSEVYLKDTPYIDKEFKNLKYKNIKGSAGEVYLKDTHKNEAAEEKQTATGDVAPVRSMPIDESAKKANAQGQCDLEDYLLAESFKERFKSILPNIQLVKLVDGWGVRPYPYFQEKFSEIQGDFGEFFAGKCVKFALLKAKTHREGEIIIKFQ